MKAKDIFGLLGPNTTDLQFGPEPTLKEIIQRYYEMGGIDRIKAQRYTREYIEGWISLHGKKIP